MASSLLPDRAILAIAGRDAEALLNRLFTRNLLGMSHGEARYAALLSPQGKLLFDFLVLRQRDAFQLDCPRDLAADLAKRLTMFRLRAEATIAGPDDELHVAAGWNGFAVSDAPAGVDVYRDPRHPALGWRIVGPHRRLAPSIGTDDYATHRVALGIPESGRDWVYGDSFVHDANLDLLNGVDFDKGCYVGQEVVSRVHHRGSARKRVAGVRFLGDAPDQGADLVAGPLAVGRVTTVVGGQGLASVRLDRFQEAIDTKMPILAGETLVEITLPEGSLRDTPEDPDVARL